ncbi:hypothetical protein BC936DRAFT_144024, partial [Jimgerdemannia flammicorona]
MHSDDVSAQIEMHSTDSHDGQETIEIFIIHHIVDIPDEPSIFHQLQERMKAAADDIVDKLKAAGNKVQDTIEGVEYTARQRAQDVEDKFQGACSKVRGSIECVEKNAKRCIYDVEHRLGNFGNKVRETVEGAGEKAKQGVHDVKQNIGEFGNKVRGTVEGMEEKAKQRVYNVKHSIGEISYKVRDTVEGAGEKAKQSVHDVKQNIGDFGNKIRDTVDGVEQKIEDFGHTKYTQATESLHKGVDEVKEKAQEAEEIARSTFGSLMQAGQAIANWWGSFTHKAAETKDKIHEKLEDRLEEQMEPFFTVPDKVQGTIDDVNARALRGESDKPFANVQPWSSSRPEIRHDFSNFENMIESNMGQLQHYWDGRKADIANKWFSGIGPTQHASYTPLASLYVPFFALYFLVLSFRVWLQRKRTAVYLGDGTLETMRALREDTVPQKTKVHA